MTNPNVGVKDKWVEAVLSGDLDTVRTLCHPDFVLEQPKGLIYAGTYRGLDGFLLFLELFDDAYEIGKLENTRTFFCDDPDVIVLEFAFHGTMKSTGEAFRTSQLEHWFFRDSMVLGVRPHWFEMPALPAK
ncbi:MAG: nuclear transport factor 2 family protein [Novosphingobium sp.]|nr:nuclear transport factor 2 family protein [Novosphingobium sp.]